MQDKSNLDLYNLVLALAGTDSLAPGEQGHILAFANRRLYDAYKASNVWPRYVVVGEPRSVYASTIQFTQDGKHIFAAGTSAVNGLFKLNGTQASAAAYSIFDDDGTTELYSLIYVSGTIWHIIAGAPSAGGAIQYINTDTSNTATAASPVIAETGWTVSSGTTPAPTVRDLLEIDETIRIHRTQPYQRLSACEYDFYVDSGGIHGLNITTSDTEILWVTYKKDITYLTELNADTSSTLEEVPLEFFYYVAHATYADFLRMDGQTEKAMIEEKLAIHYLNPEIERAEQLMNSNMLKTRIHTHTSRQYR